MDGYEIIEKVFWWFLYPLFMIVVLWGCYRRILTLVSKEKREEERRKEERFYHDDDYKIFGFIRKDSWIYKWQKRNQNRIILGLIIAIIILFIIESIFGDAEIIQDLRQKFF